MKSQDFITENDDGLKQRFSSAFAKAGIPVHTVNIDTEEDDWLKISAKGTKRYRAGIPEKLEFKITDCWWEPNSDEISGKVLAQKDSADKKYSQVGKFTADQITLNEFAKQVNEFVMDLVNAVTKQYKQGERDYLSKGGTGMMPGSVKKDYK